MVKLEILWIPRFKRKAKEEEKQKYLKAVYDKFLL